MSDVLNGRIDSRAFTNSIILVGAYAPGMQDNFKVPNGKSREMYGVEIHANILQSYLQGRFSINGNPYLLGIITAVIAMLLHLLFRKIKPWQSIIVMVIVVAVQVGILISLNNKGYAFSIIYLPLALLASFIYALAIGYVIEQARKKEVINAFKKYVAPQIVDEISKKGEFQIKLGGENRDIAVLFVDIRGFTTMSEVLEPEQVVAILNEYLSLTTKSIFDNMGTLDKFVGDATMAVFNSPFDLPDYEFKAVCAAMDIVNGGKALEKTLLEKYGRTVGFGVGVNVGPAVVGNIGCDFRMDFTAIGDTVNTAARLEANAKKGQVLISDVLYDRIKDRIEVNEIGEIPLKGKSKGVFVYEVTEVHNA
jgi:adenylate cyclase